MSRRQKKTILTETVYGTKFAGKKNWSDPLVTIANEGQGKAERKLRGILRTIILFKNKAMFPRQIEKDLVAMTKKIGFLWTDKMRTRIMEVNKTKIVYEPGHSHLEISLNVTAEELPGLRDYLAGGESTERSWRIYYDQYLFQLMWRLQDPEWVGALRMCPGCKRLLLSSADYPTKWCGDPRCRKRVWAQKHRRRVECPAEDQEITLLDCKQVQKDEPYEECTNCQYSMAKKGGK